MKKIDASHWRGRLAASLLFTSFLWATNILSDVLVSSESWGHAARHNILTASIAGVIWFIIFTIWPNAGRAGRESGSS